MEHTAYSGLETVPPRRLSKFVDSTSRLHEKRNAALFSFFRIPLVSVILVFNQMLQSGSFRGPIRIKYYSFDAYS
jgi:hypothetical protein